jgi:hypothetical protein
LRPPLKATIEKEMDEATELYYASAYSPAELQTFHCEKVRKMHLSGLDPSMLVGFLCRDAEEWRDFRKRVVEVRWLPFEFCLGAYGTQLPRAIFSVQEEPPSWPSVDLGGDEEDDGLALESVASSDDPRAASASPLSTNTVASVLTPVDTTAAADSSPNLLEEPQSPWSLIDIPPIPQRVNSDDSGRSNGIGKGRFSFAMEGFRNKLRTFGRSRTSLALTEGEGK